MLSLALGNVSALVRDGFGAEAHVRTRRPGTLFQVSLPAYMADGDAAAIYMKPGHGNQIVVSDLGHTCMRLSYSRKMTREALAMLDKLAERHGFRVDHEEISVTTEPKEIVAALLGMIQIQSEAESVILRSISRAHASGGFRRDVRALLEEKFRGQVSFDYHEPADMEGLYSLDALIKLGGRSIGVAITPRVLDAERAVASKLHLVASSANSVRRWIAIPEDIGRFDRKTQLRLMKEFLVPVPKFEDERAGIVEKIYELAS